MKASYKQILALPPQITFSVTWEQDDEVDQSSIDLYVDGLTSRPGWYTDSNGSYQKDTRAYMLEKYQPPKLADIFGEKRQLWQCECCQKYNTYAGIQIGHKTKWKAELKKAGVLTTDEAKAAYNNLCNLRIECSTCNSSHDNE